jgi:predicted permease
MGGLNCGFSVTMFQVFLFAAVLITAGALWRHFRPFGLAPESARGVLSAVVYNLLLPALVLGALWRTPVTTDMARISALAVANVLLGLGLSWTWCRVCRLDRQVTGALLLASAFGNVTYLGLPVLEASLGAWARAVAIQYDLFGCTPLLFTVGILVARHYGHGATEEAPLGTLLRAPPVWAAIVAVTLSTLDVPLPAWLAAVLNRLAAGVAPLMLLVIGLSLVFERGMARQLPSLVPVSTIQLVIMPVVIWMLATALGVGGDLRVAVVLEAGMPSMVLGIVLCERYGLDTARYAQAVTVTTIASMATLPTWLELLRS